MPFSRWRLIRTPERHPYFNMALDEAFFRLAREVPTLRIYSWNPPGLSLGYFQRYSDFDDGKLREIASRAKSEPPVLVRRPTGGGAIFHWNELTFSIVTAYPNPIIPESVAESYKRINSALISAFSAFGIDATTRSDAAFKHSTEIFCFNRVLPCDVVASGKKLAGSAEKRSGGRFLAHGSIPLEDNPCAGNSTSVSTEAKRKVSFAEFEDAFVKSFQAVLRVTLFEDKIASNELAFAHKLEKEKYSSENWNKKR
jgi:lipoate-protein ligase A